jgi:hypothetical protein
MKEPGSTGLFHDHTLKDNGLCDFPMACGAKKSLKYP